MLLSRGSGPNYVEISINSINDIGHFDSVMLSMTFQGMWALILALILILADKLKFSPERRFAGFIYLQKFGHIIQGIL